MKNVRNSKFAKFLACYLATQLLISIVCPPNIIALTGGPSQPEFNSFTPIGTSDMVDLSTGDFNYNIPIMDVGGYPVNLAYNSGITMDQEASWVGLGWNINIGQINRQMRGLPDDFKGDSIRYRKNVKDNKTLGLTAYGNLSFLGKEGGNVQGSEGTPNSSLPNINLALTIEHNNYQGISTIPSLGFGFRVADLGSVGMNFSSSVDDGASIYPSLSISQHLASFENSSVNALSAGLDIGLPYNSRQGLEALTINTSMNSYRTDSEKNIRRVKTLSGSGFGSAISFQDMAFTPKGRFQYQNYSLTGDIGIGFDAWGASVEAGLVGFGSIQSLANPDTKKAAYGYDFTTQASNKDILDFNRENDRPISRKSKVLPLVNQTYDLYSVQGQGIAGQFKPFKGQIGSIRDEQVEDLGGSDALSVEFTVGAGFHVGGNFKKTKITSRTGEWETAAKDYFEPIERPYLKYEDNYFKMVGDLTKDLDETLFDNGTAPNQVGGNNPIALEIVGKKHARSATNKFLVDKVNPNGTSSGDYSSSAVDRININEKLYRKKRDNRNIAIRKVDKKEAMSTAGMFNPNSNLPNHGTNGFTLLKNDGSTYVYGEAVTNNFQNEVTFATNGSVDYANGLININNNDKINNNIGLDHFYDYIQTPAYAHSFLLTSILSADYQDLTGNGPSSDDPGTYTKFSYDNGSINSNGYKWRVPFNKATYDPGLFTETKDQKGSYIYGEKELKYLSKIETKTHTAVFELTERRDGYGVADSSGGLSTNSKMYKIESISLYTKGEYEALEGGNASIRPIKKAHFEYDYSLCRNIPNNSGAAEYDDQGMDINLDKGKLTLRKVYFTYRGSNMGRYTPYQFHYNNLNPNYGMKSVDIWGNYKPAFIETAQNFDTSAGTIEELETYIATYNPNLQGEEVDLPLTAQEFPFVQQQDKILQDYYAPAWTLSSIDLPSGGNLDIEYESDDYRYVQDKKAVQMFRVIGASKDIANPVDSASNNLYDINPVSFGEDAKFIIVEIPETGSMDQATFEEKYIGDLDAPIYFKFLVNMVKNAIYEYDYVSGYFKIDQGKNIYISQGPNGLLQAAIPMKFSDLEGGINGNQQVNPISKAGWYFGRTYLNRYTSGVNSDNPDGFDFLQLLKVMQGSMAGFSEIFKGPNQRLRNTFLIAKTFIPEKSYIRLQSPINKLGGGLRVKELKMNDNWDKMTGHNDNPIYQNFYGQQYNYNLEDGYSSGVATYEPNGSKENPLVVPLYTNEDSNQAPRELNYVEKPFGQSFFPASKVTYSQVEVSNLKKNNILNGNSSLAKHRTGKVINKFYTTKDFPTEVRYTNLQPADNYDAPSKLSGNTLLTGGLRVKARTHLTASQGFSIITNDMDGKSRGQYVIDEFDNPISSVEYFYNVNDNGKLENTLPLVNSSGSVSQGNIGVDYDIVTDFRESYNKTVIQGIDLNYDLIPLVIPLSFAMGLPSRQDIENVLHTSTTTKVIHKSGILKSTVASDLGATVKTNNILWDEGSGEVLITETSNEYDDNYYNTKIPAYWAYPTMGAAKANLGLKAWLTPANSYDSNQPAGTTSFYQLRDYSSLDLHDYFALGDQVRIEQAAFNRYWVAKIKDDLNGVGKQLVLIDQNGKVANACNELDQIYITVVKSGYKNLQNASAASVTSMTNPILDNYLLDNDFLYEGTGTDPRIINASAVEYNDVWLNNNNLRYLNAQYLNTDGILDDYPFKYFGINPFLKNIKGNWRAQKSYAYLAGRTNIENTRNSGYFKKFKSFYKPNVTSSIWEKDLSPLSTDQESKWTFASEITGIDYRGVEIENRDALDRFSSARYGYGNTLPIVVASNSQYGEMAYNDFESSAFDLKFFGPEITRSEEFSHTGNLSLMVLPGKTARVERELKECEEIIPYDTQFCPCDDCPVFQCPNNLINIYIPTNQSGPFQVDLLTLINPPEEVSGVTILLGDRLSAVDRFPCTYNESINGTILSYNISGCIDTSTSGFEIIVTYTFTDGRPSVTCPGGTLILNWNQ